MQLAITVVYRVVWTATILVFKGTRLGFVLVPLGVYWSTRRSITLPVAR